MNSPRLRVTMRCLEEDLGLDSSLSKRDARTLVEEHPAIQKFVDMRAVDPDGAEPTYGPYPRGRVGSLHVGSARGVTMWDSAEDTCWLVGYETFHRNGDPNDAFVVFNKRYEDGTLQPSATDIARSFEDGTDLLAELREAGERLLVAARAHPGTVEFETWHDGGQQMICVDILVDDSEAIEEGWIGLVLPRDEHLPDHEVYDLVSSLIPDGAVPIYVQKFRDRQRYSGEIVYRWDHGSA